MSKVYKEIANMKQRAEQHFGNKLNTLAPNILPGVKADDLREIRCSNCQGSVFHPVFSLKLASMLQTRNSMPCMVQFPLGWACDSCEQINPFNQEQLGVDQDGRELKEKTKEDKIPTSTISISVDDGVSAKEKLN